MQQLLLPLQRQCSMAAGHLQHSIAQHGSCVHTLTWL
jgi:hypothetical protein